MSRDYCKHGVIMSNPCTQCTAAEVLASARAAAAEAAPHQSFPVQWTVRQALEQAHVLYLMQLDDAHKRDDVQGEQFWGSHAEVVRAVLDTIDLCVSCEAKVARQ